VVYVLGAISDRNTSLIVGVLGLIYATVRVMFLNLGYVFLLLGTGLDQRFYELERLWDQVQDIELAMVSQRIFRAFEPDGPSQA
jgi:hypothetical protein